MSLLMMLAASGKRETFTVTFTANGTWAAPAGVTSVDLVGKGAAGSPGTPGSPVQKTDEQYTFYRTGGGVDYQTVTVNGWPHGSTYYCDPYTPFDSPPYNAYYVCHRPYTTYEGGTPATTGAATTAFGKAFPGGTGGAAVPTSYTGVPVNPGQAYSIVVPAGGSLTITYLK